MKKKLIRMGLMAAVVTMLLCVSALAADSGIYDVKKTDSNIAVTFTEPATSITVDGKNYTDFHANAVKMSVELSGANNGNYYMVFVTKGSGVPTAENLVYIDQVTAANGKATFETVYPMELDSRTTYYIHVTGGSRSYSDDASFRFYVDYKLGDANVDGNVNIYDAMAVINHVAEKAPLTDEKSLLAADVDGKNGVDIRDALEIIKYIAGKSSALSNR